MDQKSPLQTGSNERFFGSDVIASAIRELDIPYACLNPGASFRGLHDSLVNFLGNERPRMLVNLHEEHAVAMAQGYAKATNKPLIAILHSNVGLMHAAMAIFNAWVDRVPMIILGATGPLDAHKRRPHIDWIHTSQDQGAIIRDYIKWDDQPGSPEAAVEAIRKGYQIACTPPYGPVYICFDASVQEMPVEVWPEFNDASRFRPPPPPGPPEEVVKRAADLLSAADKVVMLCGRMSERSADAWENRIRLAEALNAKTMTNSWQEVGFPTGHPLHVGMAGFFARGAFQKALQEADVVLSLDWFDLGGTLSTGWDGGIIGSKVIDCSMDFQQHRGWVKDSGVLPPVDVHIPTVPESAVPALLAAIKGKAKGKDYDRVRRPKADLPADGMINMVSLAETFRNVTYDEKVCLISQSIGWPADVLEHDHHLSFLGNAGGGGLGAGPGNSVGTALALRDMKSDALPISILGDGDYLMGVQALWTAAHEGIPLMILIVNNGSYFNDELHQERVAQQRGRPPENRWIGQKISAPDVDLAALARAQGLEGIGPIDDMKELPGAIEESIALLKNGKAVVLDVKVFPEYVTTSVHERKGD